MTIKQYETDAIVPPGDILNEELDARGISPRAFAQMVQVPAAYLLGVLRGERPLTPEFALRLERVLGTPAITWVNVEGEYRLALARLKERKTA